MQPLSYYSENIQEALAQRQTELTQGYLCLLFLFFAVYLLSLSIQYTDTDLWYHMTGGRFLFQEGALYNPFVHSYLTPAPEFINYFWGFQAISYGTWVLGGEHGLVVLKAVLIFVSGIVTARILTQDKAFGSATVLHLLVISIIIAILCLRGFSLRPHLFSYVFIPLFTYILMYREKWYWTLPLLTVAWINLHGIEYVVGALILGSFFLSRLTTLFQEKADANRNLKNSAGPLLWIASCLPAMMLNPNGFFVLVTPFLPIDDLALFISELDKVSLAAVVDLSDGFGLQTLVLFLFVFWITAFVHCLRDPTKNLAAILMATGGIILLSMGKRFIWEWALLCAPLISSALGDWRRLKVGLWSGTLLVLYLSILLYTFWPAIRTGWQHYPFDIHSLPYGTTAFMERFGVKGRYAIEPSYAGYVEWKLAPTVKIHSDMQLPPFSALDHHELSSAMLTSPGLTNYIAKYDPDAIGVRKSNKNFPDATAKQLGYAPVFFDKKVVLYINKERYPEVVATYELKNLNPFDEDQIKLELIKNGIFELERLVTLVDMPEVKLTLVGMLIELRELDKAEVYLNDLQGPYKANPSVLYFAARIAHLRNDCATAVDLYEKSISVAEDDKPIQLMAAECYFLMGNQRRAYKHFSAAINPYKDTNPNVLTYYQYALAAHGIGRTDEAARLLTMIQRFDTGANKELTAEVQSLSTLLKTLD